MNIVYHKESKNQGKQVITNKKKANEILERIGVQSSERQKIVSLAMGSLSKSSSYVKGKIKTKPNLYFQALGQRVPSGGTKFDFIASITPSFEHVGEWVNAY